MTTLQVRLGHGERETCKVFLLGTNHKTRVFLDAATAELSHHEHGDAALCLQFSVRPDIVILVQPRTRWLDLADRVAGSSDPGAVFRVFSLIGTANQDAFGLKPYAGPCFLTAEPGTALVSENRTSMSDWEVFRLEPAVAPETPVFHDLMRALAGILDSLDDPDCLVSALLVSPVGHVPDLFDLVFELLDPAMLRAFVACFVIDHEQPRTEREQDCARLLTRLPQGGWIGTGLTALYRRNVTGLHRVQVRADERYDFMGFADNLAVHSSWSRGARLLYEARTACVPTRGLAVLATARDEGVYLLEWLAHHRRIGVEQFFIYTNDLTDGSDEMLRILSEAGELVWIDNTGAAPNGINMQFKAYHHALRVLPEILDYRWSLVIDLDEVVLPTAGQDYRLPPLLDARGREGAEAVAMSWRILGPNGRLTWAPGLSAERFVETGEHPLIKTAFRTGLFFGSFAHHPTTPYRRYVPYMTIDGEQHRSQDLEDHEVNFSVRATVNACICHYHIRSLEEFVWKFARGENDGTGVLANKHFRYNNPGIFELFSDHFDQTGPQPVLPLAEEIRSEIRRYMALPGMADAVHAVERHFREQSAQFVEQSIRIMSVDDRISEPARESWGRLVAAWREKRAQESTDA